VPAPAIEAARLPEEPGGGLQQPERVGADVVAVGRVGRVQLRRQRDGQAGHRAEPVPGHDQRCSPRRQVDPGEQARPEQQQPGQRRRPLGRVHDAELGRPAGGGQEDRRPRVLGADQPHQLLDVVQGQLVAVEMAARPLAAARATAVEPVDLHSVMAEMGCRLGEPAGVAGDPVEEDEDRRRRRRPVAPAQVVEPHTVAGREESALGISAGRVDHWPSVRCQPARGQRLGRNQPRRLSPPHRGPWCAGRRGRGRRPRWRSTW
jgi:hypothetical protein